VEAAAAVRREEGMAAAAALSHAGDEGSGIASCCTVDGLIKIQRRIKKRVTMRGQSLALISSYVGAFGYLHTPRPGSTDAVAQRLVDWSEVGTSHAVQGSLMNQPQLIRKKKILVSTRPGSPEHNNRAAGTCQ
jgi:hypothetical protein